MGYLLEYDETNPISIETYGKRLIGKTFQDICDEDDMRKVAVVRETENYEVKHENKKRKGGLGELVEERYFHYQSNNDARPDFDKAGVELKVTPYKINKNGSISAKERLILTMIDYCSVVNESFEESHMWAKARLILLVYYLYRQEIKNRLDYKIDYVQLFSPPEEDMKIIEHDFNVIKDKICAGKAHELSEGDTLYLGAATKAATSEDRREQPFSDELAKPRAFAFKNSYMTYVLNNYIVPGKKTYESIVEGNIEESFEDYVVKKIDEHCGSSELELCYKYEVNIDKKPKDLGAILAYRMLGIKSNKAEEFVKANVVVKTIRVENNNKIKEHMSFPIFRFKELVEEDWENSTFGNYLRETRFLFVVYKFDENGELRLRGAQFWNMPYEDLEGNVRKVWKETKQILIDGLEVEKVNGNKLRQKWDKFCVKQKNDEHKMDMNSAHNTFNILGEIQFGNWAMVYKDMFRLVSAINKNAQIDLYIYIAATDNLKKIISDGVVGVNAARERFQENIDNHNINKPVMIVPLDIDFDLDTYDFSEAEKGYDEISREIQELEQKISWNKKKITVLNDKKKNADSEKAKIIKEEIKDLRNEKKHNQQELDELKNLYKISDEIEEI